MSAPSPVCLACSIFQREIEALRASGRINLPTRFLGSMLHMAPERLEARLTQVITEEQAAGQHPVLVYGDCCPHMRDLEHRQGVVRTRGLNCCEVLLGRDEYRRLIKEGAFFVMPEWALRWREVFQQELGLDSEVASSMMKEMLTRLIYLDTGLVPVPTSHMDELSAFTGLPWEALPVGLDMLADNLVEASRRAIARTRPTDMGAVQFLVTDFLDEILRFSDHPGQMGQFLTHKIRELVAGRIVALVECPGTSGRPHRVLSITPSRYQRWEHVEALDELASASHHLTRCRLWRSGQVDPEVQALLDRTECNGAMVLPLTVGSQRVGVLIVLHLLDFQQADDLLRAFDLLAPVVALALRNTTFFESLDAQIRARTAELEQSERQYRSLARMAPVGIGQADAQGNLIFTNDRFHLITRMPRGQATVRDLIAHVHPDDRRAVEEARGLIMASQEAVHLEHRLLLEQDEVRWVSVELASTRDEEGAVTGHIAILSDITEKKEAEAAKERLEAMLAQSQKMESVGRLAGGVAHDFNNMLTVILGQAEILKESLPEGSPLAARLRGIEEAAGRSRDLTHQLLAFSRKQVALPRPLDVNAHIRTTCDGLASLVGEDVTLRLALASPLPPVRFDPSQMDQVLLNLILNARDAMPNGGEVRIETARLALGARECATRPGLSAGLHVMLRVGDNGSGIDAASLPHIFEPFFTTKGVGKGTGLGLATVYGIVVQNNAFIDVRSAPGQGTTFEILLPATTEAAPRHEKPSPQGDATHEGAVLLVEDDLLVRELLTQQLTGLGYRVTVADTPSSALDLACRQKYDLLLSDVVMPTMSGRELRDRLLLEQPALRVLLMSGYTSEVIRRQGVSSEGTSFLQKPFTIQELSRKIKEVMRD